MDAEEVTMRNSEMSMLHAYYNSVQGAPRGGHKLSSVLSLEDGSTADRTVRALNEALKKYEGIESPKHVRHYLRNYDWQHHLKDDEIIRVLEKVLQPQGR